MQINPIATYAEFSSNQYKFLDNFTLSNIQNNQNILQFCDSVNTELFNNFNDGLDYNNLRVYSKQELDSIKTNSLCLGDNFNNSIYNKDDNNY